MLGATFPHKLVWPGLKEDRDGEWSFPVGLQMLWRSPKQGRVVGNTSPAPSCCLPAPVPRGHGMGIGQEMVAEKCCCNEPDHKGQPEG